MQEAARGLHGQQLRPRVQPAAGMREGWRSAKSREASLDRHAAPHSRGAKAAAPAVLHACQLES